jgi:hypothetical protein
MRKVQFYSLSQLFPKINQHPISTPSYGPDAANIGKVSADRKMRLTVVVALVAFENIGNVPGGAQLARVVHP